MAPARYVSLALLVPAAVLASCRCSKSGPAPAGSASARASASVELDEDDDVKPVYPQTNDPPDPRATKYCDLVHELPETKRKECCPQTPVSMFRPTKECVRTLTYALGSKAVTLDTAELDVCEKAIREDAEKCDWGGVLPAACEGLLKGQVGEKDVCRSALECKSGLECRGLGATSPGKCMPPRPVGAACGGVADTLGAFTRQDADRGHEPCEGHCQRRRCVKAAAVGEKCDSETLCARGLRCEQQKCVDAPAPGDGQPCTESCAHGFSCISGKCAPPRRLGEQCAADGDCRSLSCAKEGADAGKCVVKCVDKLPKTPPVSRPLKPRRPIRKPQEP